MKLFVTETTANLPLVDAALTLAVENAERSAHVHRALLRAMDAMHLVEVGGELEQPATLGSQITVMAWNMQRCLYPEQSAELVRPLAPDILLVSEMDVGMARTHQRHTVRALADSLGMRYAFGLEFFEMGLGNDIERRLAADSHNEFGWHGNAVLSRVEPQAVALVRLDDDGIWFGTDNSFAKESIRKQPRVGGRCAIAAILPTHVGAVCVVSVHLESLECPEIRLAQFERLIAALDVFAPGLPVIIGGDLNTANELGADPALEEPIFRAAQRRGFSWDNNASGPTTRRSMLTQSHRPKLKLDWFCARAFDALGAEILPALDESGKALSDHEVILGRFGQN